MKKGGEAMASRVKPGANTGRPHLEVRHADLERVGPKDRWKSRCPVCGEGVLTVRRNELTLEIERWDACLLCGQRFQYMDIRAMRGAPRRGLTRRN